MKGTVKAWGRRIPFVETAVIHARVLRNRRTRIANVAMFHSARCGSTVLGNLLGQHPAMIWASELFHELPRRHARFMHRSDRVEIILKHSMYYRKSSFYGFETKFLPEQHLRQEIINLDLKDYLQLLKQLGFSHFIVLERKNYLRRVLSATVAKETDQWHIETASGQASAVTLDPESVEVGNRKLPLLEHFQSMDENYERLRFLLRNDRLLNIMYEEEILEDPRIAYRKVCQFLGMEDLEPEIKLKRTNPFPLEELVENFDDLKTRLRGTPYEWMLHH